MTQTERMKKLFDGLDRVYGRYRVTTVKANGKHVGEGDNVGTRIGKVDLNLWQGHLDGVQGIGIVPIRDDATCVFGAIDVDDYSLGQMGLATIVKKVDGLGLPLVPCRTKSGGCHLYLFSSEPVEAKLFRERLAEMSAALGTAGSEIFPKQEAIVSEKDCGSWINMPYFQGLEGNRYALKLNGDAIPFDEFLDFAEGMRRPRSFFEEQLIFAADTFSDGPPCLERCMQEGLFNEGSGQRNILMFNAGVYARTKHKDDWEDQLVILNNNVFVPPYNKPETNAVIKSLAGKSKYRYQCKIEPLSSRCDGKLCRARANGVGRNGERAGTDGGGGDPGAVAPGGENESMPRLGQLRMLKTVPPVWFWDTVSGRTIELTTEQLQSPRLFQARCMECVRLCPTMPDQQTWQKLVNKALAHCMEIDAPEDSSDEGQVWELLEKFCSGKVQAQTKKEVLVGKPWTDKGVTWFRMGDFRKFLDQQRFRGDMTQVHNLAALFHTRGLKKTFMDMSEGKERKGANVWGVESFSERPEMDVPDSITDGDSPF